MINAYCVAYFFQLMSFFYKNCKYNASMVFAAFWGDIEVRGEYCSSHRGILSLEVGISANCLHGLFFFFDFIK